MGSGASLADKKRIKGNDNGIRKKVGFRSRSLSVNDCKSLSPFGYQLMKTIGKGSYGKVKRAFSKKHKINVAIKILEFNEENKLRHARFFQREKQVSYVADHRNIVRCLEILECRYKIYIILEYVDNGDLCRYLKRKGVIEDCPARRLFNGISSAIFYLHSMNVAHRDLKLENILLSKDLTPKLSDFGFAKKVHDTQDKSATFCGSRRYSCLEILAGVPYDVFKADIWSLGVILFAMLTGRFPFADLKDLVKMKDGVSFIGSMQDVSFDAVQLIRRMLQIDPSSRISIHEVCRHSWVKESC